jgi:hypothetical protein
MSRDVGHVVGRPIPKALGSELSRRYFFYLRFSQIAERSFCQS